MTFHYCFICERKNRTLHICFCSLINGMWYTRLLCRFFFGLSLFRLQLRKLICCMKQLIVVIRSCDCLKRFSSVTTTSLISDKKNSFQKNFCHLSLNNFCFISFNTEHMHDIMVDVCYYEPHFLSLNEIFFLFRICGKKYHHFLTVCVCHLTMRELEQVQSEFAYKSLLSFRIAQVSRSLSSGGNLP